MRREIRDDAEPCGVRGTHWLDLREWGIPLPVGHIARVRLAYELWTTRRHYWKECEG